MLTKKLMLVALVGVSLAAAGCGSSSAPPDSKSAVKDVPASFTQNCAVCHGSSLEGKSGPDLTKVGARLSEDQIKNKIANGGVGMPAFKSSLGDDAVNKLASYLASKK